ncbi:uncharacterized protein LOC116350776 [Contarinia nasturtii]|uniref:uncharacterized protein LOC116350776 n=1 Tax=Contarinia nasturtii TaxID=265458 RepID=UPI0012D39048|nr:uncharacterized protein LOC116350776 [Contarinia nasturtii]
MSDSEGDNSSRKTIGTNTDDGFVSHLGHETPPGRGVKRTATGKPKPDTPITYATKDLNAKVCDFTRESNTSMLLCKDKTNTQTISTLKRCLQAADYAIKTLEKSREIVALNMDSINQSDESESSSPVRFAPNTTLFSPKTKATESAKSIQALCLSVGCFSGMAAGDAILANPKKQERLERWQKSIKIFSDLITSQRGQIVQKIKKIDPEQRIEEVFRMAKMTDWEIDLVHLSRINSYHEKFEKYLEEFKSRENPEQ